MKLYKSYIALAACGTMALASCSEGEYWTEPETLGNELAFLKPAITLAIEPSETAPSSYTVQVSRTQNATDETYNVTFSTTTPEVLSAPATVTFKSGEYTADYVISIKDMMPGVSYTGTAEVDNGNTLLHVNPNNQSFTFTISQELLWTKVNTCLLQSTGWAQATGTVEVEEGNWPVEGERYFRLVDPYYVLEPDYASKGAYISFFTDNDGQALRMGETWSYIGERTSSGGYYFFGLNGSYGSFTNEGNIYVMKGVIGSGSTLARPTSLSAYETLAFQWDCPAL